MKNIQNKTSENFIGIRSLPYLRIFLSIYLFINLIGIFNYPFFRNKLDYGPLLFLVLIGFVGFTLGTFSIRKIRINFSPPKGIYKPKVLFTVFISVYLLSLMLISFTHLKNGGIILFMGSQRFTTYTIVTLISYFSILVSLLYLSHLLITNEKVPNIFFVLLSIQALSGLSMGYRGPLVVLFSSVFFIFTIVQNENYKKFKKIFSFKNALLFAGALMLMSYIASFRVSQEYDTVSFFKNIDNAYIEKHGFLKPYVSTLSVFRYNQEVVTTLVKKTKNNHLYGELAVSNVLTLLPGTQLGARNKIGEIIGARKFPDGRPWSITPTLQGALFVDGGVVFVFIGFFILAALLEYLKKMMVNKKDPFSVVLYVFLAINSLMLIHSGYFDVSVFLLIIALLLIKFVVMRINYKI